MTSGNSTQRMRDTLDAIDAWNGHLNAIVALRDAEVLLAEAAQADATEATGPLHGVPIAVKDLVRTKGIATTLGSPLFADNVPSIDDVLAARLKAAGAIVIGKTNVPEFGLGSHSTNPVYGVTRNPYDPSRTAGGSSGGAAAALATGMLDFADGSDMMGSLRNPAGWNNTYSLRPTIGLVPSEPEGDVYSNTLSTLGPMARTPRQLAQLLDVMAGPDRGQPLSRPGQPLSGQLEGATLKGIHFGLLNDWGGAFPYEDGIFETVHDACAKMAGAGAKITAIAPPFPAAHLWQSWTDLRSFAVATKMRPLYEDARKRALLKPAAIWEIERGRALSALDLQTATSLRSEAFRALMAVFDKVDALILPTAQMWPFPAEWAYPEQIGDTEMDTYHRWMEVVVPVSLLGFPAVTVPAGFSNTGLPMGIQIFAPMGSDVALLRIAEAWHRTVDFAGMAPAR